MAFSADFREGVDADIEVFSFDDEDLNPLNVKAKSDRQDNDDAANGFESVEVTGITASEFLAALDKFPTPQVFKKQSNAAAYRFPKTVNSFEHENLKSETAAVLGTEDAKQQSPVSSTSSWETISMSTDGSDFISYPSDAQYKPPSATPDVKAQASPANSTDSLSWYSEFGLLSHISDDSIWDSFH